MTQIFPHSALGLLVISVLVWTGFFIWLRAKTTVAARSYLFCGLALGLFPTIFFTMVCLLTHQTPPPIALGVAGVVTGLIAGVVLFRESRT